MVLSHKDYRTTRCIYYKYLILLCFFGESPSGKAPDFDSGIRRFDPYLPSQNFRLPLNVRIGITPPCLIV
jgi:hypothetical protein